MRATGSRLLGFIRRADGQFFNCRSSMAMGTAAAAAWVSALALTAQTMGTPERFTAAAIDMNQGGAGNVEIVVERWSTDAERDKFMTAMQQEEDSDKLLDILRDMPRKGYFRSAGALGWDIHFARRTPLPDGGERVVLITDRRIGFWETANQPRSIDYPFTVIELRVNAEGTGEGKASVATRIIGDRDSNIVTLENYDTQPVRLTNVKRERSSK